MKVLISAEEIYPVFYLTRSDNESIGVEVPQALTIKYDLVSTAYWELQDELLAIYNKK